MSQISGATAIDQSVSALSSNRFSELKSEDFIRIIFTELANQDPLQPNDTGALLDQLNSIRDIESVRQCDRHRRRRQAGRRLDQPGTGGRPGRAHRER